MPSFAYIMARLLVGCGDDHVDLTLGQAVAYCSFLAISFVGSLYVLIPSRVRNLDRDNAEQIQWRSLATSIVCAGALLSYPLLFCNSERPPNDEGAGFFRASIIMSIVLRNVVATASVLLHTSVLYFGPIVQSILTAYSSVRRREQSVSWQRVREVLWSANIDPLLSALLSPRNDTERWTVLRNLVVAPLTEEIIFRSCMLPALRSTGMSVGLVSFVGPLFFGFAHGHHALLKLCQGRPLLFVMLETTFQFAYTFLFGSYVSYAFLQTGSLCAVLLCHAFCNWMGLPDLSFLRHYSLLYPYRLLLLSAHVMGLFGFILGLKFISTIGKSY